MARKLRIVVGLVFLAIFLTSVLAAPLAVAKSSFPERLRCRIVKQTPRYVFVKHLRPRLRLKLHKAQHYAKVRGHRYEIVNRSRDFVMLEAQALKPKKPPTPPKPKPTPTRTNSSPSNAPRPRTLMPDATPWPCGHGGP